jgi:hypothetical protein
MLGFWKRTDKKNVHFSKSQHTFRKTGFLCTFLDHSRKTPFLVKNDGFYHFLENKILEK